MLDRERSWLDGPARSRTDFPGERLGLPQEGPGSAAGFPRRMAAVAVDLGLVALVARLFVPRPSLLFPDVVLAVYLSLLVGVAGRTLGMQLFGLQVVRLDGRRVGWWAALRALLFLLLVPAVIWDRDGRGLHDLACRTVVVRARQRAG